MPFVFNPLVPTEDIRNALKYDEEETVFLDMLNMGAESFLEGAGALRVDLPLTRTVIVMMVGFWVDNRELNYSEFKDPKDFPLGIAAMINSLRYRVVEVDGSV